MIFNGSITVDPSQLTNIIIKKPTNEFAKIAHFLTFNKGFGKKEEQETFTAISILEKIHASLVANKINNIVRLAHTTAGTQIDFYLDKEGKEDDLKEALNKYDMELDRSMDIVFDNIKLILEHEDQNFKFLIDISINRNHAVGEYPIEIDITGLINSFKSEDADSEKLKFKMGEIFKTQDSYNSFKDEKTAQFEQFMDSLILALKTNIEIDDVKKDFNPSITLPKENVNDKKIGLNNYHSGHGYGVHYGYYGFDNYLMYSMVWSSMCVSNHIHMADCSIVAEDGELLSSVGEEGFDAGEEMNSSDAFADSDVGMDPEFSDLDSSSDLSDSGSSWFDSGDSGDFGGGDFGGMD